MQDTKITPSPEARQLFNRMVARSDTQLYLSVLECLELQVLRVRDGHKPQEELRELICEEWVKVPGRGSGWILS
jgi:hypothetical protein